MQNKDAMRMWWTTLAAGLMLAIFLSQASLAVRRDTPSHFSIAFRNIVYGYHTSDNLCLDHTPDGIVSSPEECDDGNASNTDSCLNSCKDATCADGYVQAGIEDCDDGNASAGDGCSAICTLESGWSCTGTVPSVCSEVCGDGIKTPSEQCDDGNALNIDGCLNTCVSATCGDGYVYSGVEACDPPGTAVCAATCGPVSGIGVVHKSEPVIVVPESLKRRTPPPNCGNAILEKDKGEQCDEGRFNGVSPDCSRWCEVTYCGDGIVQAWDDEECEPPTDAQGNFLPPACGAWSCTIPAYDEQGVLKALGCEWTFKLLCSVPSQASSVTSHSFSAAGIFASVSFTEQQGSNSAGVAPQSSSVHVTSSASSRSSSTISRDAYVAVICGNGVREGGEECDDGAANTDLSPDSCRTNCRYAYCGDSVTDTGELCDDGNDILGDGCTPLCALSTCSNGVLEQGEECDDGKRNNDELPNTCTTLCLMPRCGDGIVDDAFAERCDSAEANSNTIPDACRINCLPARCGDGILDTGEQCDDGNPSDKDSCTTVCTTPICGNNVIEGAELCDDGNAVNDDGCDVRCVKVGDSWWSRVVWMPFQKSPLLP